MNKKSLLFPILGKCFCPNDMLLLSGSQTSAPDRKEKESAINGVKVIYKENSVFRVAEITYFRLVLFKGSYGLIRPL